MFSGELHLRLPQRPPVTAQSPRKTEAAFGLPHCAEKGAATFWMPKAKARRAAPRSKRQQAIAALLGARLPVRRDRHTASQTRAARSPVHWPNGCTTWGLSHDRPGYRGSCLCRMRFAAPHVACCADRPGVRSPRPSTPAGSDPTGWAATTQDSDGGVQDPRDHAGFSARRALTDPEPGTQVSRWT